MELVRLQCDFPGIGGQQGSLLGLSVCSGRAGRSCRVISLPPERREGPQPLQHREPLEQLGNGIVWIWGRRIWGTRFEGRTEGRQRKGKL